MGWTTKGSEFESLRDKNFLFSTSSWTVFGSIQPTMGFSLGVRRLEREVDHSPQSRVEIKNTRTWVCTSMSSWRGASSKVSCYILSLTNILSSAPCSQTFFISFLGWRLCSYSRNSLLHLRRPVSAITQSGNWALSSATLTQLTFS
jgi:hypothetical protein